MERIIVSDTVSKLTGKGVEYLVTKDGTIIAKFYDGNFFKENVEPLYTGETVTAA